MRTTPSASLRRVSGFWSWCLAVVVTSSSAWAQSREDDMFGSTATPSPATDVTPATPAQADNREDNMFGDANSNASASAPAGSSTTPSVLAAVLMAGGLLADADKFTTFGGNLFLRFNGNARLGQDLGLSSLSAPSLIDVYADVRPNDRLRGFAQVRLNYDFTVQNGQVNPFNGQPVQSFSFALDQAWVKLDLARVIFLTAGKQRIRWGSGRFWNPTDFVNADIRNSVDFFDQRLGVSMVKFHVPFESLGWNLYLIPVLERVNTLEDIGLAARAEFLFGEVELALSSKLQQDQPLRFGADLSAGVWLFDVHLEGMAQRGQSKPLFKGKLDFDEGEFPELVDTTGEWYAQLTAGTELSLKYTDTDSINLGVEYFYNSAGYDDASLYPVLFLQGGYQPLFTGRHYGAIYAFANSPFDFDDVSLTLSTLSNLSDLSFLTRLDVQYRLLNYLTLNAFGAVHYGNVGEFRLGLDVDPQPFVPGLENGFTLNTDLFDVGVAARMQF
jgi:hypothetical protein